MDKQSFLGRVRQAADLGTSKESEHHAVAVVAEAVLRGVYSVRRDAISPGQIAEFEAQLPDDVRALLHQR